MTLKLAPLAMVAIGLSMAACVLVSALRLDNIYLAYAILGFGLAASLLQWRFLRQLNANQGIPGQPSLFGQLYGMMFLTGLCSAPAVLIGRVIGGAPIWTGV
ncbi:hypothetical protein [Phenylobacterium sp.]|uniref:hypothetical protein n=1 Tax=Phenylobacterium sp. TaxID=1871053 RepID=UPI002BCDAC28|nr:hypothetical protein [Phenylobacterium sp.]HLZ75686.1 hypothetical protein [Phenylobacterium sp.]